MAEADQDGAATARTQDKGHAYVSDADDQSSLSSYETQAGVKNIEAISQTWTKWSLIAAYLGYIMFLYLVFTSSFSWESLYCYTICRPISSQASIRSALTSLDEDANAR